ncbi:acetylornithine transaminase [Paludibacterium yongneupense]|uniref:acetylornithine transaminase n=1 Tax=Paludibacterium yongneupense TaxID=400061 RepID=UPI000410B590|nr:acetylornithine transaminase [Paludibacterium yongneupense]
MQCKPPLSHASLMPIIARPETVFVRGQGDELFDSDGRVYLDWVQGWAVNSLGHSPAVVVDALCRQAALLLNPSPAFYNRPALQLSTLLTENSCFDHVFFANSGAEANEGAIKLARKWGQRHKQGAFEIITFHDAFHGRTLATMSASGKPGWGSKFPPQVDGFPKATLNDLESVRALIGPATAAVMLEPVQGEAGVIAAEHGFMRALRELCTREGVLLIVDEVQTGCGRTGPLFAYQAHDIEPDIMTLGKGIGGGIALAALLAKKSVSCFEPGDQGGTFCGNPLACAAGVAVFGALLEEGFLARAEHAGRHLASGLRALAHEFGLGNVRGSGMLLALELGKDCAHDVVARAMESGLLINAPRPHCLRFMPALNTGTDSLDRGLGLLRTVLADLMPSA